MRDRERRPRRIAECAGREQEAKFWDTHDATDCLDEPRPAEARLAPKVYD